MLRGLLGENQRDTFFTLCDVIHDLTDYTIDMSQLEGLEARIHEVLSLVERDFPLSLQVGTV